MRAVRVLAAISLASGLVTIVACQEPTQVTLEVRIATATCAEINGTAINIGIRPADTEEKVRSKFPNAQTTDCDGATSRIGTLVVTPSEDDRASVIVVTSYGKRGDPTECQPPDYRDCIVARRQFTFTKHRRLSLPITIDPTCVNVPCDAFSTCRKGSCFSSEAETCEGAGDCLEPGETANGGTDRDAAVDPDTGASKPKPVAACDGATLRCGDAPCEAGLKCCETASGAICQPACGVQLCCSPGDCGGKTCSPLNGLPSRNVPDANAGPDVGTGPDAATPDAMGPIDSMPPDTFVPPPDSGSGSDSSVPPPVDSGADASFPPPDGGGGATGLGICQQ